MIDHIVLRGVSAHGYHGVLDFEKADGQTFVVDLDLTVDLARAGSSDDLRHTVNYAEIAADIVALVTGESLDLIETLAARIADAVLARPLVEAAEVTVHKPQAPVGVPFSDVAVRVRRRRDEPVVIALGGNLGEVPTTLAVAVRQIAALDGVVVTGVSPLFETDPVGGPPQPAYLNAVLLARTSRAPYPLLQQLHAIEASHGRVRETRWGARTLDLDLIQYGDPHAGAETVSDDPDITLPHPRAHERAFVLAPWAAVQPDARLCVRGQDVEVTELLALAGGGVGPGGVGPGGVGPGGVRPGPGWSPQW